MNSEHWYAVGRVTCAETLDECAIDFAIDLGGGVTLHVGTRHGLPVTVIENPCGSLNAIWYDAGRG